MVYGSEYIKAYECVDTMNDIDSCGGCVNGDSPDGNRNHLGGRDCSAIPNVDVVRCIRGTCRIGQYPEPPKKLQSHFFPTGKCAPGYDLSSDGSRCIFAFRY